MHAAINVLQDISVHIYDYFMHQMVFMSQETSMFSCYCPLFDAPQAVEIFAGRALRSLIAQGESALFVFLGSAGKGRFFVPAYLSDSAVGAAVKTGQRPPPEAARSGLEGRENGATILHGWARLTLS
jgi:hypothetical protein